jgi:hypothetical protein
MILVRTRQLGAALSNQYPEPSQSVFGCANRLARSGGAYVVGFFVMLAGYLSGIQTCDHVEAHARVAGHEFRKNCP